MPSRRTKRGGERTSLGGDYDVLVCGASFAGLTVARELAGSGARVLIVDRYEIGERQTSACAAPTEWLEAMGLGGSVKQTFEDLVIHTPHTTVRMQLPWTFSTFDYPTLCALLYEQSGLPFETATVEGRLAANGDGTTDRDQPDAEITSTSLTPHASRSAPKHLAFGADAHLIATDRGELSAPIVVDCLGWRRILDDGYQPPDAPLSRALEVHPNGSDRDLEIWIDRSVVPAGYGWSFPAEDELRVGVGSFDPRFHVKRPTVELAERLDLPTVRYQGNWIPHRIRPASGGDIFFCGDSAGHALPLTAEGIRTAFYFAIACGREIRAVVDGHATREQALDRYAAFSEAHRRKFDWMLRVQRLVPRVPPRLLAAALRGMAHDRFVRWAFGHYLEIAHPSYARAHAAAPGGQPRLRAAA
jgi:flavin-dependent dehydrogenase